MDASAQILPIVIFCSVTGLIVLIMRLTSREKKIFNSRLSTYGGQARRVLEVGDAPAAKILRQRDFSKIGVVQSVLSATSFADRLENDLGQAGIPLRVGEYFTLRIGLAIVATIPVIAMGLPWLVVIPLAIAGFFLPELYLRRLLAARLQKFNDSLVDALSLMANAMKSGSSFLQALDLVAKELPAPLGEEFGRVVTEISVGTPVEGAMTNLANRVKGYDLFLMVTAVLIQRETGGNLAEILTSISGTIRERIRLIRQVRVLTAQERMGSILVGSLPIFCLVGFTLVSPAYTKPLFEQSLGHIILAAALGLEVIGFVAMDRVSKIEV